MAMSLCPPLDMLYLPGEPSLTQPKSPEYWSETPCSPVATKSRGTLNEKGGENSNYLCVYVCVCSHR